MIISLTVGDFSGDGHNQFETRLIESNLTSKELRHAYNVGITKIGFNLEEEVEGYEDNLITAKNVQSLIRNGYPFEQSPSEESEDYALWGADEYVELWLFFAKIGNNSFEYELIHNNEENNLNIGGYGLYA